MSKSKKSSKYSKFKEIFIALDIVSNMCYTATDIQNGKHRISVCWNSCSDRKNARENKYLEKSWMYYG